jgi:hypothetical protein
MSIEAHCRLDLFASAARHAELDVFGTAALSGVSAFATPPLQSPMTSAATDIARQNGIETTADENV